MRMTIERMNVQNFKGTRDLSIDFGAETTRIFGMNGTGKTTIPDAFCWVLFNKDSHGNAPGSDNFREKPLDADGHEIHNLDTTVELLCTLDGKPFNLRRTQRENWVRKRGSTNPVYQGNVSTYWVNDVETKVSDFKARIAQITSEEIFRLVGTLSAFNAIDWKKRREQLMSLSGIDVDAMLLQRDEYRQLADECAQRNVTVEELRKVFADQRRRTNTELQMIPVRIDEARKSLPSFTDQNYKDAEFIVADTKKDIANIDVYIAEAKAAAEKASNRKAIEALQAEAMSIQRAISEDYNAEKRKVQRERDEASEAYRNATAQKAQATRSLDNISALLTRAESERDKLREEYSAAHSEAFKVDVSDHCPVCGQELPPEKVQQAIEDARQKFAERRKSTLAEISQRGKTKAAECEQLAEGKAAAEKELAEAETRLRNAELERDAALNRMAKFPAEPDYEGNPRITEIRQQIAGLEAEASTNPEEKVAQLEARKLELNELMKKHSATLAARDAAQKTKDRIKELEAQQVEAGQRIGELEVLIALVEQFVQDRCVALEESINEKFPSVRWKLFDIQINGGIADTCTCMIPCDSGLVVYDSANTAAQINADIEIINVLSEHYGVELPLFVDNSERVNRLGDTNAQLITLSVSTDSELRIEA